MVDEAFEVYNLNGDMEMRIPLSTKSKYGAERMMYHRADLHQTLKERATSPEFPGRPATIQVSNRVIKCGCEQGRVETENGQILSADLVIGADGIKSIIRQNVLKTEVGARTTGLSAYRMMIPVADLLKEATFLAVVDPRKSCTTMVVGNDRRLIMGPARNASIYGVVGLVPDEQMFETSGTSWTMEGDHEKMMETFADFPDWVQTPLRLSKRVGLWQLRDLDPLKTWCRGRVILVGDAAHAMLPTQGQGASQAIEDAEALGAFYDGFENTDSRSIEAVTAMNNTIFRCRYDRATTIQTYSRQAARPGTESGSFKVKMHPAEFMDYNCSYNGALDWQRKFFRANRLL